MTAFARHALHMTDGGYSPVPISLRTGTPLCPLSPLRQQPMSDAGIARQARQNCGAQLAVALGYKNLIAIDVDTDDPDIIAAVRLAVPEANVTRRGSKGFVAFYLDTKGTIESRNFKTKDGKVVNARLLA